MKNKYLVLVDSEKQEKVDNVNFLFPLVNFCVGIKKEYSLEEIPNQSYLYVNRILNCDDIFEFERLLPLIENKIKGIVFEDLGILQSLKKYSSKLETILFASHAVCSSYTANSYLKEVDTVIISPDITESDIRIIESRANKPISIYLYGNLPYMYSRRFLLSNYQKEYHLEKESISVINEPIYKQSFFCIENKYGTILYDSIPMDARSLMDLTNVKYYFLNLEFCTINSFKKWLDDFSNNIPIEKTTTGFLNKKTIYKLPPRSVRND